LPEAEIQETCGPRERPAARVKPRLRGVSHQYAFFASLIAGPALVMTAPTPRAVVAATIYASGLCGLLGASALYHRVTWSASARPWLRRVDHAGIYGLIAGTYTPFGLIVLHGAWQIAVLSVVWAGALAAATIKFVWLTAPKWLSAALGIALGWVGVVVIPQLLDGAGPAVLTLVVAGGVCYTVGALVYARRKPDPFPSVFGYHEVFHALVIVAVGLQYAAVAFTLS